MFGFAVCTFNVIIKKSLPGNQCQKSHSHVFYGDIYSLKSSVQKFNLFSVDLCVCVV